MGGTAGRDCTRAWRVMARELDRGLLAAEQGPVAERSVVVTRVYQRQEGGVPRTAAELHHATAPN